MRRRKGYKANGLRNDVMCSDGVMDYGWRLVRKGGIIKAYGSNWQDNKLLPFVGQYVAVNSTHYWCTAINVYRDYPTMDHKNQFICKIGED